MPGAGAEGSGAVHSHGAATGRARVGNGSGGGGGDGAGYGRLLAIGIGLNAVYVVVEAGFGFATNSLGLIADAGHNLSDVLSLGAAWLAHMLATRPPTAGFTYGLKRTPILAALFNAVLLLVAMGAVLYEAVRRFLEPAPLDAGTVMLVAAVGVIVNGGTALLLMRGRQGDLNIRGAFLHMVADTLVTVGVIAAAAGIALTGWFWLDPLTSVTIAIVVLWGTWGLLQSAVRMSLDAVPAGIEPAAVRAFLLAVEEVQSVHDLHIWPISTTETALTAHLVLPRPVEAPNPFLARVGSGLRDEFGIDHATLQLESGDPADPCGLVSPETV